MKKCPHCHKYTVEYDASRKVTRCMADECSCIIVNDSTYLILKPAASTREGINLVKVVDGEETDIVEQFAAL